jgi:hypothetical protein
MVLPNHTHVKSERKWLRGIGLDDGEHRHAAATGVSGRIWREHQISRF